ncbi:MAG: GntR family transcriptional regulator [Oscillospiraceae bacterium]|nr:GntR family transcriptional regulator [Oscillospiraceae bacterium]
MTILINNRSGQPIYQQIYSQIRQQILNGVLAEDEALPSIRSLAKDLRISVITTKRAYEDLEKAGLIYTLPGKGSFVAAGDPALLREDALREIEEHMLAIRRLAAGCGLGREELREMYDLTMEDEEI